MRVAAGGHIAQPEAVLAFVIHHREQVFAVGGNGGDDRFIRIGHLRDGEILEGNGRGAMQHRINAEARRGEDGQSRQRASRQPELVLLCGGDDRRTAAMGDVARCCFTGIGR